MRADKEKKRRKKMSEYLLATHGLTKQFGHHKAVDHVDLHVKKVRFTALSEETELGKRHF